MVSDMFGSLLEELGKALANIPLHPDSNNSCLIRFKEGVDIQLEMDRSGQFLILGCKIGDVPAGRYRENLFTEALKANGLPYPTHGAFAYSQKANQLILFERINVTDLNGEKIAAEVVPFIKKAQVWVEALQQGTVPNVAQSQTSASSGGGIFGLR